MAGGHVGWEAELGDEEGGPSLPSSSFQPSMFERLTVSPHSDGRPFASQWDAYPDLLPRTSSFPPIQPLGRATPFYYLAAFEPWAATMETQTLAARNVVGLLAEDWWGLKMGGAGAGAEEGGGCEGEVGGRDWTCM